MNRTNRLSRSGRVASIAVTILACLAIVGTGYASARAAGHHEARHTQVAIAATPGATAAATATPAATATATATPSGIATTPSTVPQSSPSQPSIPAPAPGPVIVAIGDSIMEGHGLAPDRAWLALLASEKAWQFTNLASDGSGFVAVGSNGDTFADQAAAAELLHPDVVIFSGSSNDLGVSDSRIDAATAATIAGLHAALPNTMIVSISAIWGDTDVPSQFGAIDSAVETATAAVGGTYLDAGQPLSEDPTVMQADRIHPTATGRLLIARAVQQAMMSTGVTF